MPGDNPLLAGSADSRARRAFLRTRSMRALLGSAAGLGALSLAGIAHAQERALSVSTVDVIQLAVFAGVMGAALLSAVVLIRERGRIAGENGQYRARIADLNTALQRSEALLNLRDQRVVVWASDRPRPELIGSLPTESGAPDDRASFLAFGRWLMPRSAAALEHAIAALRDRAVSFDLVVETQSGAPLEVQGRKTSAHVLARFIALTENQRQLARLRLENQRLAADHANLIGLADALPMPFWIRGSDGRLKWVNRAYAEAVEAQNPEAAVRDGKELLGTQSREQIAAHHQTRQVFTQSLSTVVAGDRRVFAVTDFAGSDGSSGIAQDVSAVEAIRTEYESVVRSHADTLDQLTTAVAIFDERQKLRFFNQAFLKLWDFDQAFLDSGPDHTLLLDRLRSEGRIAEQPEWRRWKENLLEAYRAVESVVHWWHLPDGRTIRVVANPQPKGGVTWVFENLTEQMNLESRYNTAVRVQGETLDNLAEGVAVFGPDGRIRLANPAFALVWQLPKDMVEQKLHINTVRTRCDALAVDSPWSSFVASVTGFDDDRRDRHGRTELKTGTILRYAVIHLPNGQVMITFVDITDSVKVERALTEKNEALRQADQLRNDFVHHVSYELRSPLTNIIGFTEVLSLTETGPLTPRQREYVEHIGSSSAVLLTIVNDILDLATIDAGIMELEIAEVEISRAVASAAQLVADQLQEHSIRLDVQLDRAPVSLAGDEIRIRQVLYNLLTNAANYAPAGSAITLTCRQVANGVEFAVHDDGPGMAPDVLDTVFRRFEAKVNGGRRRGAGLGLSIVKSFVELHGGSVQIETGPDIGTTVRCFFPTAPSGVRAAAE